MSDEVSTPGGIFKYHLQLTPAQLKITHTALHSLLDDFGHDQAEVHQVIRDVLDKLPDDHAIRAIRLEDEIERELGSHNPGAGGASPGDSDDSPPDSVA